VQLSALTALYIVDSRVDLDDDEGGAVTGLFERLVHLKTLVLSNTRLRQLSRAVSGLTRLEVLKLDGNRFDDLPADLDRLTALTTLCLDRQRPRLRVLPPVITKMHQLQVKFDRYHFINLHILKGVKGALYLFTGTHLRATGRHQAQPKNDSEREPLESSFLAAHHLMKSHLMP